MLITERKLRKLIKDTLLFERVNVDIRDDLLSIIRNKIKDDPDYKSISKIDDIINFTVFSGDKGKTSLRKNLQHYLDNLGLSSDIKRQIKDENYENVEVALNTIVAKSFIDSEIRAGIENYNESQGGKFVRSNEFDGQQEEKLVNYKLLRAIFNSSDRLKATDFIGKLLANNAMSRVVGEITDVLDLASGIEENPFDTEVASTVGTAAESEKGVLKSIANAIKSGKDAIIKTPSQLYSRILDKVEVDYIPREAVEEDARLKLPSDISKILDQSQLSKFNEYVKNKLEDKSSYPDIEPIEADFFIKQFIEWADTQKVTDHIDITPKGS